MATRKRDTSDTAIAKKKKQGDGQGSGSSYKPWITVHDVSSTGRSHQVYSHKSKRIHHLLSDLEKYVFLTFYWSDQILDIREQFPLKRDETQEIAKQCGIKHPAMHGTDIVMTTDFLVDTAGFEPRQFAVQVKYAKDLFDKRTIEKLEIERRYWQQKKIPWLVVTEKEIDKIVSSNIQWLIPDVSGTPLEDELKTTESLLQAEFKKNPGSSLIEVCKKIDNAYQCEIGNSLRDARILIANGFIKFDIRKDHKKLKCADFTFTLTKKIGKGVNAANK